MPRYSDTVMEHFTRPRNQGRLEEPDALGLVGVPGEGPYFLMAIHVRDGRVARAAFQTYGCGPSIAAGSFLTEWILGRSLAECRGLTADWLTEELGGVPPDKAHCPALAVGALHAAVDRYLGEVEAANRPP